MPNIYYLVDRKKTKTFKPRIPRARLNVTFVEIRNERNYKISNYEKSNLSFAFLLSAFTCTF